jgi:hypothetical protein
MPFNDVTFDQSRVASYQCGRNAMAFLYGLKVLHFVNFDWKTIARQMRDPRTTAASKR